MPSHVKAVRRSVPSVISVKPAEAAYSSPSMLQAQCADIAGKISKKDPSGKNPDQEMLEKVLNAKLPEEENVTFSEFAENSTFHGIKYIFNSGFIVRRIMWILCVIGAVVLFITQVGSRTLDFFNYTTSVDVQLTYTNSIKFPAVTLCNQNNFRTSTMVNNGLYYFIDEVYSTTGQSNVNVSEYEFTQSDSVRFLKDVAHQFEDLVDQCVWNGQPCDRADFITTITDVGVCFTFNSDRRSALKVKESGSAFGLTLILNVEQYEYMKGPNNDAGVKILLHDQTEFPLMKDKGFAVAPGTHTIVIVEKGEVQSLEPPYGTCDGSMVKETRSDCLRTCRTKQMVEECGCMDSYMDNSTVNTRVCDIPTLFGCVKNAKESGVISDTNCDCGVPCFRHTYKPTMSYAQLSQFNIERLVLVDPINRERAEENFIVATEYSQRVVVDIANADAEQLNELVEYTLSLDETIQNISESLVDTETFQEAFDTIVPLDNYETVFDPELSLLGWRRWRMNTWANTMFPSNEVNTALQSKDKLDYLLEIDDGTLQTRLDGCAGQVTPRAFNDSFNPLGHYSDQGVWVDYDYSLYYSFPNSYNYYSSNCHYYLDPDSYRGSYPLHYTVLFSCYDAIDVCDVYVAAKREHARSIREENSLYFNPQRQLADQLRGIYMNYITTTFDGAYTNPDDINMHRNCLDMIDRYANEFDSTSRMRGLLDDIVNADNYVAFKAAMEQLERSHSDPSITTIFNVLQQCKWYHAYIGQTWQTGECYNTWRYRDWDCENYREYQSKIAEVPMYATALQLLFSDMSDTVRRMRTLSQVSLIGYLFGSIERYLDMNITKSELSEIVHSYRIKNALIDIASAGNDFVSSGVEAIQQGQLLVRTLEDAYTEVFTTMLPLMNGYIVESMAYIEYARESNNTEIQRILEDLHDAPLNTTIALINEMYGVLLAELERFRGDINTKLDYLAQAAANIEDSLDTYTSNTRMNYKFYTENFLQVDVFYKELSYERVEQQPSFPLISLFSEVGGFLGLLLGASILTVCELLDWIVMTISTKCRKRKDEDKTAPEAPSLTKVQC